jgi:hypothetical protein
VQSFTVLIPAEDAAFANAAFSAPRLKMMRLGLALMNHDKPSSVLRE